MCSETSPLRKYVLAGTIPGKQGSYVQGKRSEQQPHTLYGTQIINLVLPPVRFNLTTFQA